MCGTNGQPEERYCPCQGNFPSWKKRHPREPVGFGKLPPSGSTPHQTTIPNGTKPVNKWFSMPTPNTAVPHRLGEFLLHISPSELQPHCHIDFCQQNKISPCPGWQRLLDSVCDKGRKELIYVYVPRCLTPPPTPCPQIRWCRAITYLKAPLMQWRDNNEQVPPTTGTSFFPLLNRRCLIAKADI